MADDISPRSAEGGRQLVKRWLDQLDVTLRNEAELAGLLGHGTLIGSAREFMVNRVLRSILPPSVHVGTGRVVGAEGMSKQVDVVVSDPRCPLLEVQPGVGLYFVEGVIATMEIKSKLTTERLREALDNCNSVHALGGHVTSLDALNESGERLARESSLSRESVEDRVKWGLTPRTYIFSFTTEMSRESITKVISEWYGKNGQARTPCFPCLPAVIVTQGTVGLLSDDWLRVVPSEGDQREIRQAFGEDAEIVMGLWSMQRQFGALAMRLLHDVCARLPLLHPLSGATLSMEAYLPGSEELEADRSTEGIHYVVWGRQPYEAARDGEATVSSLVPPLHSP